MCAWKGACKRVCSEQTYSVLGPLLYNPAGAARVIFVRRDGQARSQKQELDQEPTKAHTQVRNLRPPAQANIAVEHCLGHEIHILADKLFHLDAENLTQKLWVSLSVSDTVVTTGVHSLI